MINKLNRNLHKNKKFKNISRYLNVINSFNSEKYTTMLNQNINIFLSRNLTKTNNVTRTVNNLNLKSVSRSKNTSYSYISYINKYKKIKDFNIRLFYKQFSYLFVEDHFNRFINILTYRVENTMRNYVGTNVLFTTNFYTKYKYKIADISLPPITNAKMLSDLIVFGLQSRRPIRSVYYSIKRWHLYNYNDRRYLESLYFSSKLNGMERDYLDFFSNKAYPIAGIRIECSGTIKKGKRKRKYMYGDYVFNVNIIPKAPNNTLFADIDYSQSYAITRSSTIGIKVWVFFKTHLYDVHGNYLSLVTY
jgi:hypothetical protein